MKKCRICLKRRKETDFPPRYNRTSRRAECVDCRKEFSKFQAAKRSYGISKQEYKELIREHNGFCAICNSNSKLGIDHCHSTGRIRGLLCNTCNRALGLLKDDIEVVKRCVIYLSARGVTGSRVSLRN